MQINKTMKYYLIPIRMSSIKKKKKQKTNVGKDVEESEPCATVENSMAAPQNIKNRTTM